MNSCKDGDDDDNCNRPSRWRNARTHSDAQVAEIAGSIRAFGFCNAILVGADGDIIAGHGRNAAARLLGLAEVPVIELRGLTDMQRRQLMLADNRIALNAGWDADMLALELKDLSDLGADLSGLGFTAKELAEALRPVVEGLTGEAATLVDTWWCHKSRASCSSRIVGPIGRGVCELSRFAILASFSGGSGKISVRGNLANSQLGDPPTPATQ
jgi:hypothetical protein